MPSPFKFQPHGQSGIEVSELFPEVGRLHRRPLRHPLDAHRQPEPRAGAAHDELAATCSRSGPSMGSWLTYGLGTENQNLPGFVVLCPGKPVVGPQLWSNSFLPGVYQGTHINNTTIDPRSDHPRHPQPLPLAGRPARAARPAAAS